MTNPPFDRYGHHAIILWRENGRPLDRWERDVDEVRAHVAFMAGLIDELRDLAGRCDDVLLGRETGPRFWSRFAANIEALERVVSRDNWFVEALEQAARDAGDG